MIENYKKECSGCRACEQLCPKNAIKMEEDYRGFIYPKVDYSKCIKCGICKNNCPINNKEIKNEIHAYAAYNKDEKVRLASSSGGIFTVLANFILEKNGVVIGAAINDNFLVDHIIIENKKYLEKLRTSKYVQSNTLNTYKQTQELLENDRIVYYSGTPCQIEGLKSYLKKDYSNLYTQDIICHGVPSPKVWKEYLKYKNKEITEVNFRCKEKSSWGDYQLKFKCNDEVEYIDHNEDKFMKLFLQNLILRDSCYQCNFKKKNRMSDITLADFWGINNINKDMNDEKGTSLVIVNSPKGENILNQVSSKIIKKEVNFEQAISYNVSMLESSPKGKDYDKVLELIKENKFNQLFEEEF